MEIKKNYFKIEASNTKAKLLNRSLLWMSFGLIFIILVAYISTVSLPFLNFIIEFSFGYRWSFWWIINIVLMFSLFFMLKNKNVNLIFPIVLYSMFAFYEGMFITSILVFSGTTNLVGDLLLYMLIPGGIFLLMGFLGYFNLIDFSKLIPFAIMCSLGMFVLLFVVLFTGNLYVEKAYFILALVVFIIWVGVDLRLIVSRENAIMTSQLSNKELNRISFMFGFNLFIDFISLLQIIIQLSR